MYDQAKIGEHAIVVGAGMGGLCAAAALSKHFARVTVLERDALPQTPVNRAGVPQGRLVHALLPGGQQAIETLLPGFTEALVRAGAVRVRGAIDVRAEFAGFDPLPQRDLGIIGYSLSRPLLELVVRTELLRRPNVTIEQRSRVLEIEMQSGGKSIAGIKSESAEGSARSMAADLVVDATGRAALTLPLLESLGRPAPRETVIGVDLGYACAVYEIPADAPADWKIVQTMGKLPEFTRGGLLSPLEGNQWIVAVGGLDDPPPGDHDGFLEYAKGFRTPTIYEAIRGARPVGEVARYGFRESVWRHFEALPGGLLPFSDSICRFNPVYGQGMSVAALEAVVLERLMSERAGEAEPLNGLGDAFLAEVQPLIAAPWEMSAIPDLASPKARGERPANFEQILQYGAAFMKLMARDADVHKLAEEVRGLLKPPSVLRDPAIVQRVMEFF